MKPFLIFAAIITISACKSPSKHASEGKSAATTAKDSIALHQQAQQLYSACAACHGTSAEGNHEFNAPALVNQDAWYLVKQLINFKKGIRGTDERDSLGLSMSAIARSLSDSLSMVSVANYIKTLPPVVMESTVKGNVQEGFSHYNMICGACHGQDAEGIEELGAPKLTGIDDWYLERQLMNFKHGIRGSDANDKGGIQMKQMVSALKDDQAVKDVVAYIQSLQTKSL